MRALTLAEKDGKYQLKLGEKPIPNCREGECLVKIHAAALNRRDYWISKGRYPSIRDGVVLGSDGCGVVDEGPSHWKGKTVLINPNQNWGDATDHQGKDYSILGVPHDGTIAEYINVPEDRLIEKPDFLTDNEAAGVPLAGLTAFRALFTKAKITDKSRVLVTGIGGGVSQFALQFALVAGATVSVTSSSQKKLDRALELGAEKGYDYTDEEWWKQAAEDGKFDAIIDSAGGNAINDYLHIVKMAGKIVVYGSTTGKADFLDVHRLFWTQASIMGSTMGSDEEFDEMIRFVSKHQIKPVIDKVWELDDAVAAVDSMESPDHFGKTVIAC